MQPFRTITKIWFAFNEKYTKTIAKIVLIPLGLTAAASATDAAVHQEIFGSIFEIFGLSFAYDKINNL